MEDSSLAKQPSIANALLRARCNSLRVLLSERENLLGVVLSLPANDSLDVVSQRLTECAARTLKAADEVLSSPVHGLSDLQEKFLTFQLLEPFYAEDPLLASTLINQVCVDVQSVTAASEGVNTIGPGGGNNPVRDAPEGAFTDLPLRAAD